MEQGYITGGTGVQGRGNKLQGRGTYMAVETGLQGRGIRGTGQWKQGYMHVFGFDCGSCQAVLLEVATLPAV